MSDRWRISAGVIDAGFASLATFGIGIFSIRYFDPALLGSYALVFAAFNLAVIISRELLFVPGEIAAVSLAPSLRLGFLPTTLRLGFLPALAGALLVSLWTVAAPASTPRSAAVAFTITAVICTFLSPVQDHVRRMLHIGGRSWLAALISAVQFTGMLGALVYMLLTDVPLAWIPFGSLAIANFLSLSVGLVLVGSRGVLSRSNQSTGPQFRFLELVQAGRWLLIGGLFSPASVFVASVLVSHLASVEALGYAEAARVVARPLPVLATGLSAVLRPQSMEAAQKKQLSAARATSSFYIRLMTFCGVAYLALVGFDTPWNPLAALLPTAYVIGGLASATILADILSAVLFPYRFELLGDKRTVALTKIEATGGVLRTLVAGTAGVSQAFAMPLGQMALNVARWIGYRTALRGIYSEPGEPSPTATSPRPLERVTVVSESPKAGD